MKRLVPFGFHGQVLVAQNGKILLNEGYGLANREQNIPNTAHTAFDTGSINKPFTAIAIMQLIEQGKLSLDTTLQQLYAGIPNDKASITIQHLLSHTSGLENYHMESDFQPMTQEEALDKIFNLPMIADIGSTYYYSNAAYGLLAIIIEMLSGQSYRDYMRDHILIPANMTQTGWYGERIWNENQVATGYVQGESCGSPYKWDAPQWALLGAGGLVHPVSDLFKAHEALKHNTLLSAETNQQMLDHELAWAVEHDTPHGFLVQHNGASMYGFSASFRRYLDHDIVITLAVNVSDGDNALAVDVENHIVDIVFGKNLSLPPTVNPSQNMNYQSGDFSDGNGGILRFTSNEKLLVSTMSPEATSWFFPLPDASTFHQTMREIAQAIAEHDLARFKALFAKPERVPAYQDNLNQYETELGQLQSTDYLGCSSLRHYTVAYIRLFFENGNRMLPLAWEGDTIAGRIPIDEDKASVINSIVYPQTENAVAGHNLLSGTSFTLTFTGNGAILATDSATITLSHIEN
ncbi:MAG: serine hydrolase domain-containing protein [Chloroflexota bacterium]